MNVGLFGGTFDPIHRGHLAVARAAARRFRLKQIYFVPSSLPPHRQGRPLSPYHHRFAMVALAIQGAKSFIPSSLEAPSGRGFSYSIDTVHALKREMGKRDRLYFIIGIDAFMDIAKWHRAEALLREADFIVASRPGYALAEVAKALPQSLRPPADKIRAIRKARTGNKLTLGRTAIHLLPGVKVPVSATQVRGAARRGKALERLVSPVVAEYIQKAHLYRQASER